MDRLVTCIFAFLLMLTVVFANDTENPRQNPVNSKNEHAAALRASSEITGIGLNSTNIVSSTAAVKGSPEYVPSSLTTDEKKDEMEDEEENDEAEEEDVEGEEEEQEEVEDEYEDELKTAAESHEAMSKDETRNSNLSAIEGRFAGQRSQTVRTFESQERNTENVSDEDDSSNEAITDEILEKKKDREVAQLLQYKKDKIVYGEAKNETKTKRVPTVKKELSTQKEILAGRNETEVLKSLVLAEKSYNGLNEGTESLRRRDLEKNELSELERTGDKGFTGETGLDDRYTEPSNRLLNPRKVDKRQETALKEMLTEYTDQQEHREKLEELGMREGTLARSLLKLLVKLAEDPSRWERVHQLLRDMENDLELTKNEMDTRKRNYELEVLRESVLTTPASAVPESTKKSRKKPSKNRKKTPSKTTTETPWLTTTPVQWRLVGERLSEQPWSRGSEDDTSNVVKVRYCLPLNSRTMTPLNFDTEVDNKNGLKTLNDERQAILLGTPREFPGQSRQTHFGKVNTHQSPYPPSHRKLPASYERDSDSDRLRNYDSSASVYQPSRYDQFTLQSHEYSRNRSPDDYQSAFGLQEANFARNREYRPSGQEFAMTKSWPERSFKYSLPWKPNDRPLLETSWPWRQNDMDLWSQRPKHWQIERDNARRNNAIAGETEKDKLWTKSGEQWNRQEQKHQSLPQRAWEISDGNTWPLEKSANVPPVWPQAEQSKKHERKNTNVPWEKSKNRSEQNKSSSKQENKAMPKISMKTWNSLTSDPATWPFKLQGAKPWPKDKNGKSYNPNADLVRKLGLDKQTRMLSPSNEPTKDDEYVHMDAPKYETSEKINHYDDSLTAKVGDGRKQSTAWSWMLRGNKDWNEDWNKPKNLDNLPQNDNVNSWRDNYDSSAGQHWHDKNPLSAVVPKIQSVNAWVMPADQSTWKPYEIKHVDRLNENYTGRRWPLGRTDPVERSWPLKTTDSDSWNPSLNGGNPPWSGKVKTVNTWPPKLNGEDSWNSKVRNSWSSDVNKNNDWNTKVNGNSPWNGKTNNADPWNGKSRNMGPWRAKLNEGSPWTKTNGEGNSWQQKISEEWNDGLAKGNVLSGSWPSKWKQFVYHRVTALPMTKPGTTADASSKPRNAFVAVSAVSSPKYGGNSWRKNDIEDPVILPRNENVRSENLDHQPNQPHTALESPIYAWKKDGSADHTILTIRKNETDPLENQLESLREGKIWSYKNSRQESQDEAKHTQSSSSPGPVMTTSMNSTSAIKGKEIPSDRSQSFESYHQDNFRN